MGRELKVREENVKHSRRYFLSDLHAMKSKGRFNRFFLNIQSNVHDRLPPGGCLLN